MTDGHLFTWLPVLERQPGEEVSVRHGPELPHLQPEPATPKLCLRYARVRIEHQGMQLAGSRSDFVAPGRVYG
jgi:hypothetical protein